MGRRHRGRRARPPRAAPPLRFFTPREEGTARALTDRLLAQDNEPRVPVLELIDARLAEGQGDGYRYEDMPGDAEAWRRSIAGLDADAQAPSPRGDRRADGPDRGRPRTRGDWHGMPAGRVFNLWMRYACTAFYSHPWAWNEIGFGGPAYPRGYANLGIDRRETWELPERDASDPIPWAERAERRRRGHAALATPMRQRGSGTASLGRRDGRAARV